MIKHSSGTTILVLLILISCNLFAQESTNTEDIPFYEPGDSVIILPVDSNMVFAEDDYNENKYLRAAMLSAAFPGLGQIYNGKYWKLPIIYSGVALFAYWIDYQNGWYWRLRNALFLENDGLESTENPYASFNLSGARLERQVEQARRDRDYLIILACVFYAINIMDAYVDAHLNEFDVSEDISMKVVPNLQLGNAYYPQNLGLTFQIKLD